MWFGVRDIGIQPVEKNGNLDFYDYFISTSYDENASSYNYQYQYLGFKWTKKWNNKIETDFRTSMNSALRFNSVYLKANYALHKYLNASISFYNYPQWMNSYLEWINNNEPGFDNWYDTEKWPQWSVYDNFVSIGVNFPIKTGILLFQPGINAGVSVNNIYRMSINRSHKFSNYLEIRKIRFDPSPALFLMPELDIQLDIIKFKKSAIGFQMHTAFLIMKKGIDYSSTVHAWTMENSTKTKFIGNKHNYKNFEFDGGLFYRW